MSISQSVPDPPLWCPQPHRPRPDGSAGGGRHKKRVRQAQNTRQRHLQMALEHGEYITHSPGKSNGQLPHQASQQSQQSPQVRAGVRWGLGRGGMGWKWSGFG